MTDPTATFAAVAITLYAGHMVGDHWVQRDTEALRKGEQTPAGRWYATRHVVSLTATKVVFVGSVALVLDLPLTALGLVLGLGLDAASHWWADRRHTLRRLARATGKRGWWDNDPQAPYLLDQSWHIGWLVPAALVIATV